MWVSAEYYFPTVNTRISQKALRKGCDVLIQYEQNPRDSLGYLYCNERIALDVYAAIQREMEEQNEPIRSSL